LRLFLRVLYVTFSVVIVDQITKLLVKGFTLPLFDFYHQGMQLGQSFPVFGDFLRITFVENPGMIFGIDVGGQLLRGIFTLALSLGILFYIHHIRKEPFIIRFTFALILGGAIGNLIDRMFYGMIFGEAPLFYGRVVDFLDMDFFHINFMGIHTDRFAVFNVADACVSTGMVLMLLFYRKFSRIGEQTADAASAIQNTAAQDSVVSEKKTPENDLKSSSVNPSQK
jgi:signal peptidase II